MNNNELQPRFELRRGDLFQQAWLGVREPLAFRVLSVDREKNSLTVKVIGRGAGYEETWDDLDVTEMAFEIGEYRMLERGED